MSKPQMATNGAEQTYVPRCILVTGAAGFIASNFVNQLMRENPKYKVVVFDKLTSCASLNTDDAALVRAAQLVFDRDWESAYSVPLLP